MLAALSADRLTPQLSEVDLHGEDSSGHKILGLVWHSPSNELGVKVTPLARYCTRRGLLFLVMSVFNPLGILTLFAAVKAVASAPCWDEPGVGCRNSCHRKKGLR